MPGGFGEVIKSQKEHTMAKAMTKSQIVSKLAEKAELPKQVAALLEDLAGVAYKKLRTASPFWSW